MFCTHCGASVQADQRLSGVCGASVSSVPIAPGQGAPAAPVTSAAPPGLGRVARHGRMLGVLWIALSAIHLLRGVGRLLGARMLGLVDVPGLTLCRGAGRWVTLFLLPSPSWG